MTGSQQAVQLYVLRRRSPSLLVFLFASDFFESTAWWTHTAVGWTEPAFLMLDLSRKMSSASMPSLAGEHHDNMPRSPVHKKCCASSCIASEPALIEAQTATEMPSMNISSSSKTDSLTASQPLLTSEDKGSTQQAFRLVAEQECCRFSGKTPSSSAVTKEHSNARKTCSVMSLDSSKANHTPLALARSCGNLFSYRTKNAAEAIVPLINESGSLGQRSEEKLTEQPDTQSLGEQPDTPSLGPYSRLNESCGLMCRICHSGSEDEELITPCKCMGTVRYAHQSCILNWISKSGHPNCELCKYKFKTTRMKIKSCWKWSFPHVSTKGWLHIGLFIAFTTMLLTSVTWIVWSRASDAPTALAERTTEEVKFAYMLNGLFIALAIGGLYFDSYKHFKRYSKRWAVMNQHMVIECYFKQENVGSEAGLATETSGVSRRDCSDGRENDPGTWV